MPKQVDEPRVCYAQAAITEREKAALLARAAEVRQTPSTVLRDALLEAMARWERAKKREGREQ